MSLQDVSNDQTMISWLRQSGHAHLLDEQLQHNNASSSSPPLQTSSPLSYPPPSSSIPSSYPPATSSIPSSYPPTTTYPPPTTSVSSPPPPFGDATNPLLSMFGGSAAFPPTGAPGFGGGGAALSPSPPLLSGATGFNAPYDVHASPLHMNPSPTQFLGPGANQQQIDMDIENMKRDPNTRVVQRPPQEDVVYKQRVFVRYLQPPTPPVGGTIIVREKQPPGPPPDPPIVIKRAPPVPPTPPPVIIRERPPPLPAPEGTTVIDKIVLPGPKPPRQVVIEQYPALPPKPQDIIIERWLPTVPRQRRILYERLPPPVIQPTRPVIVQYGPPQVRIQREVHTTPGAQLPSQPIVGGINVNPLVSQMGINPQIASSLPGSSLVSYNPFSTIQPSYGIAGQSQPNIVIMQGGQPNAITSANYGMPMTCVCTPNQPAGLGAYGAGLSAVPTIGQAPGQTMMYNVPGNVPIDNVLRQLGIDPHTVQPSASFPPTDPRGAVSHVWNAASHANPPHGLNSSSAVSHVWNAAAHAVDHARPGSPAVGNVWDRIEHYLHPQPSDAVRSAWNHIPHPNSPPSYPPPSNYPPPPGNYPPPQSNYPPPPNNYPPPASNYPPPPPTNYPPPPSNYPPPNYPPPSGNYPPPPNYPPPGNYPPPPGNNPPPPGGAGGGAGASVLSKLFGGGR